MKEKDFDILIQAERDRKLPTCPATLEANVLRRIRIEMTNPSSDYNPIEWLQNLLRPTAVLGLLSLTILLSTVASAIVASTHTSSVKAQELASSALDFGILRDTNSLNLKY